MPRVKLSYWLYVKDFIQSMIEIPTAPVLDDSSTVSSKYLAGQAYIYDADGIVRGNCSASFLCMQNQQNIIYSDISNYLSDAVSGLIISWFTPSTLANLELDSIVNGMVTECLVTATTKVGQNPYYGKQFNMVVSSADGKIFFTLREVCRHC